MRSGQGAFATSLERTMTKSLIPAFLVLVAVAVTGCVHTDEGDTSPMRAEDPQTRLEKSTKAIEESNMTPEQKQAALNYVRQGYASASKMKQSSEQAQSKPKG